MSKQYKPFGLGVDLKGKSTKAFRQAFLHGIPATNGSEPIDGVQQITNVPHNSDTKDSVVTHRLSEVDYFEHALLSLVNDGRLADRASALQYFQPLAEKVASVLPVKVAKVAKTRAPGKLAKKYKLAAAKSIHLGTVDRVNAEKLTSIGKVFTPTNDNTTTFKGTFDDETGSPVKFEVSDADATAYGRLIKQYQTWKAKQALQTV